MLKLNFITKIAHIPVKRNGAIPKTIYKLCGTILTFKNITIIMAN
jgi:hypothetical protein